MENNFNQLCVWPATLVGEENIEKFENFFLTDLNVRVKFLTEIKTLPDLDNDYNLIPETGGRNDVFFYIHDEDITKFAIPRLNLGIKWWEDVIKYNDTSKHLYTKDFITQHPPT